MDARPKISKHLSSKLPDVFIQPRTVPVREKKVPVEPKSQV